MLLNRYNMNIFDIVTIIVLVLAAIAGARKGFITQLFSLLSIVGGWLIASAYGPSVGQALGIDATYSTIAGYAITFIATTIDASIVARILAKLFSAMGLGGLDTLMGIVLSAAKYMLVLSVVFTTFERLNTNMQMVEARHFESSKSFRIVSSLSGKALDWFNNYTTKEAE